MLLVLIMATVLALLSWADTARPLKLGGGGAVVCFNGIGDTRGVWAELLGQLGDSARVYTFDLPGTGDRKGPPPETLQELVTDVRLALGRDGCQPPYTLVAHSGGCIAALLFRLRYPALVAKTILVDPTPRFILEGALPSAEEAGISPEEVISRRYIGLYAEAGRALPWGEIGRMDDITAIVDVRPGHERDARKRAEAEVSYPRLIVTEGAGHWIHRTRPAVVADEIRR